MKKDELLNFGIPEEKIKEFQKVYWTELRTLAQRINEEGEPERASDPVEELREAIFAMVRLFDSPERLRMILANINRNYAQHTQEQREQPKTGVGGVTECL